MFNKSIRAAVSTAALVICLVLVFARTDAHPLTATNDILLSQPPDAGGALLPFQSSQLGYDWMGNDYDQYIWDDFTLPSKASITQVDWRGVYTFGGYWGGPVADFVVSIWATNPLVSTEPDVVNLPLVEYIVNGNANENPVQPAGQVAQSYHDYSFVLPTPFVANGGTRYWIQIEGIQNGATDWGIIKGTGGDGLLFGSHVNYAGGYTYWRLGGDAAFTLRGTVQGGPSATPTFTATPTQTATQIPTCVTKPSKLVLLKPANTASVKSRQVFLDWDAYCADYYRVTVVDSVSGKVVDNNNNSNLGTSQYTTSALPKRKTYLWRVKACNTLGCKTSVWWSFKISKNAVLPVP